jgi:hypothetical protein
MKFKLIIQLSHIIKKMGVRDEIINRVTEARSKATDKGAQEALGLSLVMLLVENVSLADKELYQFITDLTGLENIPETDMQAVIKAIIGEFKKVDFKSFFSQLSSMMK